MSSERDDVTPAERRVDAEYWRCLSEGVLAVPRCEACAAWIWPAEWRCWVCGSYEIGWEEVVPEGHVYSWTRTHHAFAERFADLLPYVTLVVELRQAGGVRLMGRLVGSSNGLQVGAAVRGSFEPASSLTADLPVVVWTLGERD